MPNAQEIQTLDANIKARIQRGQEIEVAVPEAMTELGINLDKTVIAQIVAGFKLALRQANDPAFVRKQKALDARIRRLVKREKLSIARAVLQAQDDTGVKLAPEGTKLLIVLLEEESEKMNGTLVEVISDEEYKELCDPNWDRSKSPVS
jgi:hypothetical protein